MHDLPDSLRISSPFSFVGRSAELELLRGLMPRADDKGGRVVHGQVMTIHIFKSEYQPLHRLTKYWYSVMPTNSPYDGRASVIYSDLHHLRRRIYEVRVNSDTRNPRILEELRELTAAEAAEPGETGDSA
jgi:hypothetical protein